MNLHDFENRMKLHGEIMRENTASPEADLREENTEMKVSVKGIGAAVVAAAVIVALGLTALGAAFRWNERFLEFIGATPEQEQEMTGASGFPQVSASDGGWTFNVLQTVTDSHALYVLFEAEYPEGTEITDEMNFEHYSLNADYDCDSSTLGTVVEGCNMLSHDENKAIFMDEISGRDKLKSGELTFKLKNFGYYAWNDDKTDCWFVPVWEGEVKMDWAFDYSVSTKIVHPNVKIDFPEAYGRSATLTEVEVSPLSVWLKFEGDDVMSAVEPVYTFSDGSEIRQSISGGKAEKSNFSFSSFQDERSGGITSVGRRFDEIHDVDDLVSVTVHGVTITL